MVCGDSHHASCVDTTFSRLRYFSAKVASCPVGKAHRRIGRYFADNRTSDNPHARRADKAGTVQVDIGCVWRWKVMSLSILMCGLDDAVDKKDMRRGVLDT